MTSAGRVAADASRFAPFDPVRKAGARTADVRLIPARSSPPFRWAHTFAARLSLSGASWWATMPDGCADKRAPPWSRRAPAWNVGAHERIAPVSHWRAHRHLPPRSVCTAARSSMSGASLPATQAGMCGREALIQTLGGAAPPTATSAQRRLRRHVEDSVQDYNCV